MVPVVPGLLIVNGRLQHVSHRVGGLVLQPVCELAQLPDRLTLSRRLQRFRGRWIQRCAR